MIATSSATKADDNSCFADGRFSGILWSMSRRNSVRRFKSSAPKLSINLSARGVVNNRRRSVESNNCLMRASCSLSISSPVSPNIPRGNNGSFVASSNIFARILDGMVWFNRDATH